MLRYSRVMRKRITTHYKSVIFVAEVVECGRFLWFYFCEKELKVWVRQPSDIRQPARRLHGWLDYEPKLRAIDLQQERIIAFRKKLMRRYGLVFVSGRNHFARVGVEKSPFFINRNYETYVVRCGLAKFYWRAPSLLVGLRRLHQTVYRRHQFPPQSYNAALPTMLPTAKTLHLGRFVSQSNAGAIR